MLSVEKCREILGVNEELTDQEIEEVEIKLYAVAELFIEEEAKDK